jgi:outer membrane protein TolC
MLWNRFPLVATLLVVGIGRAQTQPPKPPDTPISLDDAIHRAEVNEPTFAAALAESQATRLERKDAIAGLLPSVVYHNQYLYTQSNQLRSAAAANGGLSTPVFIANNAVHEYISQASVNETIGLAGIAAVRVANATAARADAELEITRRGLVQAVVALYYGSISADAKVQIAQRALDEASRFLEITTQREAAREAAHADVIKARLGQQQRTRELEDAKLAAARARLELGVLLFPDPATSFTLAELQAEPLPDQATVEAAARQNNPEIRSAMASLRLAQAQTLGAKAALLPDLALNYSYGIDAPQLARHSPEGALNLGYSAYATLDIPVWDWLSSERRIKESHLRSQAAEVSLSNTQRHLLANLAEFYDEAAVAQKQVASLEASVLDAQESLRLTKLRYVNGEGSVLEVVDAENTLILAETDRTDGIARYQLALAQLQTLTGRL